MDRVLMHEAQGLLCNIMQTLCGVWMPVALALETQRQENQMVKVIFSSIVNPRLA